ncbi:MAG: ABC transporter ATP-binding protein [Desulfobacterales bacterium]
MKAPIIEIKDLFYRHNGHPVLNSVSFSVKEGDFLALIGPNGGGKTTLIKLMVGLLPPNRGRICIMGKPPGSVSRRIGYVPQDVNINTNFPISVADVVRMGRLNAKKRGYIRSSRHDADIIQKALQELDMWDCKSRRIGELSGGQRQRVLIARALAAEPEILFLDEPTSGVDAQGQVSLYDRLKELNKTVTIVMATHDTMVISSYIKSVACVNRDVYYHDGGEITDQMMDMYTCPVEVLAHGLPHRVLRTHKGDG